MSRDAALRALALAMQNSLEAMLELLDVPADETGPGAEIEQATCSHPEEQREHYSTMGVTRWLCRRCGYLYEREE